MFIINKIIYKLSLKTETFRSNISNSAARAYRSNKKSSVTLTS